MGDVVSLHPVRVGVSSDFAWMLLGMGSSSGRGWVLGMVNGCVPG